MTRASTPLPDRPGAPRVEVIVQHAIGGVQVRAVVALMAIGGAACRASSPGAAGAAAGSPMSPAGSAVGSPISSGPPSDAPLGPGPSAWVSAEAAAACAAGASATIDDDLRAEVAHGLALVDHVGADAAARIAAALARDPARTLDRYTCLFLDAAPAPADVTGFLALPLWRLRAAAPERVRALARRVVDRYDSLAYRAPDPADPDFAARLADRTHTMTILAGGLDVTAGPRWRPLEAGAVTACVTPAPDGAAVIAVTQTCSCGQTIACAATAGADRLALSVHYDPEAPAMCTDCYGITTACSLPPLPARAKVAVTVGGHRLATWSTDARGTPTDAACP